MRRLRGTKLDLFGMTAERRMERQLIVEFEELIDQLLSILNSGNMEFAKEVVQLYMDIRGYGPVKEQAIRDVRKQIAAHAIMSA